MSAQSPEAKLKRAKEILTEIQQKIPKEFNRIFDLLMNTPAADFEKFFSGEDFSKFAGRVHLKSDLQFIHLLAQTEETRKDLQRIRSEIVEAAHRKKAGAALREVEFDEEDDDFGPDKTKPSSSSGGRNYLEEFNTAEKEIQRKMNTLKSAWTNPRFAPFAEAIAAQTTITEIELEMERAKKAISTLGEFKRFSENVTAIINLIKQKDQIKADLKNEKDKLYTKESTPGPRKFRESPEVVKARIRLESLEFQLKTLESEKRVQPNISTIMSGIHERKTKKDLPRTTELTALQKRLDELNAEIEKLRREKDKERQEEEERVEEFRKQLQAKEREIAEARERARYHEQEAFAREIDRKRALDEQQRKFDEKQKALRDEAATRYLERIKELEEQLVEKYEKREFDFKEQYEKLKREPEITRDTFERHSKESKRRIEELEHHVSEANKRERETRAEFARQASLIEQGEDRAKELRNQLASQEIQIKELEESLRKKESEKNTEIAKIILDIRANHDERVKNLRKDSHLEIGDLQKNLKETERRMEALREELNQERKGIGDVELQYLAIKTKYETELSKVTELQAQIGGLQDDVLQFQRRSKTAEEMIEALKTELIEANKRTQELEAKFLEEQLKVEFEKKLQEALAAERAKLAAEPILTLAPTPVPAPVPPVAPISPTATTPVPTEPPAKPPRGSQRRGW